MDNIEKVLYNMYEDKIDINSLKKDDFRCYYYAKDICSRKLKMKIVGYNEKLNCVILATNKKNIESDKFNLDYFWDMNSFDKENDRLFLKDNELTSHYLIYSDFTNDKEITSLKESSSSRIDFKTVLIDFIYDKNKTHITLTYKGVAGEFYKLVFSKNSKNNAVIMKICKKKHYYEEFTVIQTEEISYSKIKRKKRLGRYLHDLFSINPFGKIKVSEYSCDKSCALEEYEFELR